jgi:hypothetical protein
LLLLGRRCCCGKVCGLGDRFQNFLLLLLAV